MSVNILDIDFLQLKQRVSVPFRKCASAIPPAAGVSTNMDASGKCINPKDKISGVLMQQRSTMGKTPQPPTEIDVVVYNVSADEGWDMGCLTLDQWIGVTAVYRATLHNQKAKTDALLLGHIKSLTGLTMHFVSCDV